MRVSPTIPVTLSNELLGHLRGLAADLDIPLEWIVAGLVCDTVEGLTARRISNRLDVRPDRQA
jgi:hypothetical protein